MLTFLPFEAAFYAEHRVPVAYVGHPLADELPLVNDRAAAREALELDPATPTLALLPGSRSNEVRFQGEIFLRAAAALRERLGELQVVIPRPRRSAGRSSRRCSNAFRSWPSGSRSAMAARARR